MLRERDDCVVAEWSPARETEDALAYIGALAASIRALEPDFQVLAARVRWALQSFEDQFDSDDDAVGERYEMDRTPTGAGDLYDAVVDMAELLLGCVAGIDGRCRRFSASV